MKSSSLCLASCFSFIRGFSRPSHPPVSCLVSTQPKQLLFGGKPPSVTPSSLHMRTVPAPSHPQSSPGQPPEPAPGPEGALFPLSRTQHLTNFVSPFRLSSPALTKGRRRDDPIELPKFVASRWWPFPPTVRSREACPAVES